MKLNKIPTGIKTFDVNINDGFPAGSVILLLEDIGAGAREFLYTSIFNLSQMKSDKSFNFKKYKSIDDDSILTMPDKICYISTSKSLEDILKETAYAYRKDFHKYIQEITFKDLSEIYFQNRKDLWISDKKEIRESESNKNILDEISGFLNKNSENNIIVIDSLTDLMLFETDCLNKDEIIMFLKGMARASKTWNGLIYIILSANILDNKMQEIIKEIVDGVLVFEWYDKGSDKMKRNLYIPKFRGLITRLEQNKIAKFETRVTYDSGFEVSNVKKII